MEQGRKPDLPKHNTPITDKKSGYIYSYIWACDKEGCSVRDIGKTQIAKWFCSLHKPKEGTNDLQHKMGRGAQK